MKSPGEEHEPLTTLRAWHHVAIFLFACLILISRRPDTVFHAQFLHEDGHVWFADVYNFGWLAGVWRTYEGYHHLFPRLGAALALLVPLSAAPLVLSLIAIGIQALPVNLLLSVRSSAWGSVRFRALLAGVYLALPDSREMLDNISQSQWPLTLCAFLLIVGTPPRSMIGRCLDLIVIMLCGLTGPQCVFLFPIALYLAWKAGERWHLITAGFLAITCVIQGWGLLNGGFASRPHAALGATAPMFVRIFAGQVLTGTVLGGNGLAANSSPQAFVFLLCFAIAGTILGSICFARSAREMKLFTILSAALLAVSLLSPTAYPPPGVTMWQMLAAADGIRYWYFPSIVFAWLLLWGVRSGGRGTKVASAILLGVMCFAVGFHWRIPAMPDRHFSELARQFESAPPGTVMIIPENPVGWDMQLVKHAGPERN